MTFTARQQQIADAIKRGLSDKLIAAELSISEETVAFHLRKLFAAFHCHSRLELLSRMLHERAGDKLADLASNTHVGTNV